jgi:hypothetical protein
VLRDATDAVMDALTAEVAVLRGEPAPTARFDPRAGARHRPARSGGTRRTA